MIVLPCDMGEEPPLGALPRPWQDAPPALPQGSRLCVERPSPGKLVVADPPGVLHRVLIGGPGQLWFFSAVWCMAMAISVVLLGVSSKGIVWAVLVCGLTGLVLFVIACRCAARARRLFSQSNELLVLSRHEWSLPRGAKPFWTRQTPSQAQRPTNSAGQGGLMSGKLSYLAGAKVCASPLRERFYLPL